MTGCVERNRGIKLTPSDRCDRCGARAQVATSTGSASILLWCAHHYQQNAQALLAAGAAIVIDQR
jgi:hypothetical protein